MKLILDHIIYSLQKHSGMSVYWYEITRRLNHIDSFQIENIFFQGYRENKLGNSSNFKDQLIQENLFPKLSSFLEISNSLKEKTIVYSSYYRISSSANAINIITIHDMIPELFFKGIKKWYHRYRKKKAIQHADRIICISESTKIDLLEYYPEIPESKVSVIYNGVSADYFLASDLKSDFIDLHKLDPKNYILYVGARTFYKRFDLIIDYIRTRPKFQVVIVGAPLSSSELELLEGYNDCYTHLSYPSNEELNVLYNNAFCLFYPSLYEGFGIPIAEAMRCGCPILCYKSNITKEITGNHAFIVDDQSLSEYLSAITRMEDSEIRKKTVDLALEKSQLYSWDKAAEQVLNLFTTEYEKRELQI